MSPLIFNILIDVLRPPRLACSHNHFPLLTPGDPSVFVRLIHDGQLRLEQVEDHTEDELRGLLDQCGQSVPSGATKVGDEPSARHRCLFIAITSKLDDHKTRQGHKYPPCRGEAVQVSCDKSNPSWLRPGGPIRSGVKAFLSVSLGSLGSSSRFCGNLSILALFPSLRVLERTAGLCRLLVHARAQRPLHGAAALGSPHSRQAVQALPAQGKRTSATPPVSRPRRCPQ